MQKKYSYLFVLFAMISWPLSSIAATTVDPGSNCVKWRPADPDGYLVYSEIHNPSASKWLRLDCPVQRTDFGATGVEWGRVSMKDKNPVANGRCHMVSYYRNGAGTVGVWATPNRFTSGAGEQAQYLHTGALASGLGTISHLYFSCHLPPMYNGRMSSLINYYVRQ